ncbi:MAG: 3-hydroxyacyl-CoA dehydrogenase [Burkholderiales bacterium]|nr:3-hydroxyacyl-CoA dehydrogenase [Burkholderiales bacterium]
MNPKIAIVGAGLIGRAWAIVFARAGHPVAMTDIDADALARAHELIGARLADLREFGLIDEAPAQVLARITCERTLAAAVADAALVQENVRETLDAKRAIFAALDPLAPPRCVLASSTSWIPASQYTEALAGRGRAMVAHPTNPPYLIPLVELCPAPWTDPDALARARALYAGARQEPVTLSREIHGFLLNRVQGAVLNECFSLYTQGLASAEDIDKVLKEGLALRWSFMGPFETIDLNAPRGVADYAARYGASNTALARAHVPFEWDDETIRRIEAERRAALPADRLEARAAWRDRRLMALLAHKRDAARL